MREDERVIRQVEVAGRRFAAAEVERHAALEDLTRAFADLSDPDLDLDELAIAASVPLATLIAIRARLPGPLPFLGAD
ncbi:MAG: hypothetical protein JWQ32_3611 [Marmoricola sp.]|nr:hypothetical protein [Marmoricola sp.]